MRANKDATKANCIVAIGGSAGALEAFENFFKALPDDINATYIVIQHMNPSQKSHLPELLKKNTSLPIGLAKQGGDILPRHIYVIEPGTVLEITKDSFVSLEISNLKERHFPIDRFFTSLALHYGSHAIGILFSGTGTDGTIGLRQIQDSGGRTLVQQPAEAKFPAMVESAIAAGAVDRIMPVWELAKILSNFVECTAKTISESDQSAELAAVCEVLHQKTGHDFSSYKKSTVARRVERRLQANLFSTLTEYLEFLKHDPTECRFLLRDLLISVTQFFRDKDSFEFLRESILPKMFAQVANRGTLRVWVPACATGDEAYSLAILILEYQRIHNLFVPVQIFATDIDRTALEYARAGHYPLSIADHLPNDYLTRYFVRTEKGFQASLSIREICVFSEHSLLKNPPFSRIDLISCRNLFIYWEPDLQSKVIPVFHYSLNPNGFLFLGPAENVTGTTELFRVMDKKFRIFQRVASVSRAHLYFPVTGLLKKTDSIELTSRTQMTIERDPAKVIASNLLENYAPPAVVINEHGDIAYFSGDVGSFLGTLTGTPTNNIFDQIKRPLRPELHALVHKCVKTQLAVTRIGLMFEHNTIPCKLNLSVRPLPELSEAMGLYLVVFQEIPSSKDSIFPEQNIIASSDAVVQQLESELRDTREHLQSTIEELKSSNEELLSMNEELQSANEELQTSKEELQSTNEELETVNTELFRKVEELDSTYSDLQNFFQNTQIPTIFLDDQARIQKFNPSAIRVFRLIPNDTGRPIADITALIDENQIVPASQRVIETLQPFEKEVNAVDGKSQFIMRIFPYRTLKNVISGVVITFADVTELKKNEAELQKANHLLKQEKERLNSLFLQAPAIINIQIGPEHVFTLVHPLTKQVLGRDVTGMKMRDALPELEGQGIFEVLDQVYSSGVPFHGEEVPIDFKGPDGSIKKSAWNFIYQPWKDEEGKTAGVMTFAVDVTEQVEARKSNEESQLQFLALANTIPQLAWMAHPDGYIYWYNNGWYDYSGTTPEQMEGWGWQSVHDPNWLLKVTDRWKDSIATGEPFEMIFPLKGKDGLFRRFLTRVNPMKSQDGKVVRWFGTNTDIDEVAKVRESLQNSEERLQLALAAAQMGTFDLSIESGKLDWSQQLAALHGINLEEFRQTYEHAQELTVPEDHVRVKGIIEESTKKGLAYEVEYRVIWPKDKSVHWLYAYGKTLVDDLGHPIRSVGTVMDITEQKKIEASLKKVLHERDQSLEILSTINSVGKHITAELELEKIVQQVTDAATKLTGAQFGAFFYFGLDEKGKALLLNVVSGVPKEAFSKFPNPRATAVFAPTFTGEGTVRSSDITKDPRFGKNAPYNGLPAGHLPVKSYLAVSVISRTGEVIGGLFFGHEKEGIFTNQAEKIVEGLAAQTAVAMDNAKLYRSVQESVRARDEFVSIASHELKTPLTSLKLQSQTRSRKLKKGELAFFDETALKKMFETDERQVDRLSRLIDDMLDISRMNTGKLSVHVEKFDLCTLVKDVVERYSSQISEYGSAVSVICSEAVEGYWDRFRIEQVVTNLLTNALRYGNRKPIKILIAIENETTSLIVQDEGIGIAKENQSRIFERFERAISASEISGLGLGLYIVKQIIEMHGGSIAVDSEVGIGSKFIVTLPLKAAGGEVES